MRSQRFQSHKTFIPEFFDRSILDEACPEQWSLAMCMAEVVECVFFLAAGTLFGQVAQLTLSGVPLTTQLGMGPTVSLKLVDFF